MNSRLRAEAAGSDENIHVRAIAPFFSPQFYRAMYADVVGTDHELMIHYLEKGWTKGYDPSGDFSTNGYLEAHRDVAAAGINPLLHYALYGQAEGRPIKPIDSMKTEGAEIKAVPEPEMRGPDGLEEFFDIEFYNADFPVGEEPTDAIAHYLRVGWKEGRDPSPRFSTMAYLNAYSDVTNSGHNPLVHYVLHGAREGRQIFASSRRSPPHVGESRTAVTISEGQVYPDVLRAFFDADFYKSGFPANEAPADPIAHYLAQGWKEGRDPTPWFSTWHYLAMHPDVAGANINPFLHYCVVGHEEGRALPLLGRRPDGDVYRAHEFAVNPGPFFEEFDPSIGTGRSKRAKVLAYYLPQFHPVEVNDRHWGKGFTEWRNLPRSLPRFMGHIQPRIPRDLGSYRLDQGETMRRQIDMARAAGLHGFCFYHYWFDGKRVLESPIERFLGDPTLDFPFCLMWANENWTRTWDGAEKEVILKQSYRREDEQPFIDDLARHMADPRYIRLGERPLFFIYRPGHIPEAKETLLRWRTFFRDRHGLDPLIFQAQAFGDNDPGVFGLDGAIEFPPHKIMSHTPDVTSKTPMVDAAYTGTIRDYSDIVSAAKNDRQGEFPLIRTLFPNWDNDARRPGRGTIISGSTPEKFAGWLDWAVQEASSHPVFGEPMVCINAWNEWAEGAYLEPDVHHGAAYLNALSRVVHGVWHANNPDPRHHILLVGHDLLPFGAQNLLLQIGTQLVRSFGYQVTFLAATSSDYGGEFAMLNQEYQSVGALKFADQLGSKLEDWLSDLVRSGCTRAITNTTATGQFVDALKASGFDLVSLVHELPNLLKNYDLKAAAAAIARSSDHVIFAANVVREGFESFAGPLHHRAEILPQGLYNTSVLKIAPGDNGLRAELGFPAHTRIVLGVGYADLRKGIDRFVMAGLSLCARRDDIAFLWVGAPGGEARSWFQPEIEGSGLGDRIRFVGHRGDVARYFAAADVFYLSSREDPFPSVVMEAMAVGLPVLGHAGCGGCDDLIAEHGTLLARNDPGAAIDAIVRILAVKPAAARKAAGARRKEIETNFDFSNYVFHLAQRLDPQLAAVSAIVPNYNYRAYIGERLWSVFDQTYPLREVIILDDASSDDSVLEINRTAAAAGRTIRLEINAKNSGSPFPQWRKGVEMAQGEYVWIAEADDLADPRLIARLVTRMKQAGSVVGFVDSRQIDEHGVASGDSYKPYINQIEPGAFDESFDMDGQEFLARFLAVKNVILNVSGVLFRRDALLDAFAAVGDELRDYSVAGDWRLYLELFSRKDSRVTYLADVLNVHRRHKISVTHTLNAEKHLSEIEKMHQVARAAVSLAPATIVMQKTHLEDCKVHLGYKRSYEKVDRDS